MVSLGMLPKKTLKNKNEEISKKRSACSSEETKKLAAAALSAVRNASATSAAGKGKFEVILIVLCEMIVCLGLNFNVIVFVIMISFHISYHLLFIIRFLRFESLQAKILK